jgi:hypothetical protein
MPIRTALLMLLASPLAAAAAPLKDDGAAIRAQSARLDRAFADADFRVWDEVMADDLKGYDPDGSTFDKAFMMRIARRERGWALPPISTHIRYTRLRVQGGRATAHGDETTCYTVRLRTGARKPLCYHQSSNDEWRKDRGVWKLAAMHDLPDQRFRLAGRPISHQQFRKIVGLH